VPSSGHEGLRGQTIELSEPRFDICEHRFDEHTSTGTTHADAIAFEPILARQAHGLTTTVSEQLGCGRHVAFQWSISIVYTWARRAVTWGHAHRCRQNRRDRRQLTIWAVKFSTQAHVQVTAWGVFADTEDR
jgi:hypothetical protein